jgi:DNA-binding response OmpR family regulator
VLLDRQLPDMLGDEVLAVLKAAAKTASIPVVVVSGDGPEHGLRLLESGAIAVLTKPFDIALLLAVIDRFCPSQG